jgi:hypothetical protein
MLTSLLASGFERTIPAGFVLYLDIKMLDLNKIVKSTFVDSWLYNFLDFNWVNY